MHYDFKVFERETCYKGFFKMERLQIQHSLFAGGWSEIINRELIHKGHAASVLLYDPKLDKVVMVEQFRVGTMENASPQDMQSAWTLELVAGFIEEGESAEEVIHREAEEESGSVIMEIMPIYKFHASPGNSSETTTLFCGKVDASNSGGIFGLMHEGEDIRVHVLTLEEAHSNIESGRINTATPIIALQWLEKHQKSLRAKWNTDQDSAL